MSGDQALFVRDDDSLLVCVIDGLGHGTQARAVADDAAASLRVEAHASLASMLESCHAALLKTRGAVATLVRLLDAELEVAARATR